GTVEDADLPTPSRSHKLEGGILKEPFKPKDLRRIVPGWPYAWYFSFLAQNCADNQPAGSAMFLRVGRGEYCLNQDADFAFDSARAATACGK
ncbi:LOW QUALITY PROTEIN: conserved hypothetical protein, partial [Brucella sp. F5/99]